MAVLLECAVTFSDSIFCYLAVSFFFKDTARQLLHFHVFFTKDRQTDNMLYNNNNNKFQKGSKEI